MSSRILCREESLAADAMLWRSAPGEEPAAEESPPSPDAEAVAVEPPPAAEPSGPTWEQWSALEAKFRDLERQIPIREQQAKQAGYKEGDAAAAARWDPALERLSRSAAEVAGYRARLRREAEADVIKLSLTIARRILRRELTMDPEALLGLVKAALDRVEQREVQRIRVRPEDAGRVQAALERMGLPQRLEVQGDSSLERGAVVLDTQKGSLDASLETQLEEIERGFADLLKRQ